MRHAIRKGAVAAGIVFLMGLAVAAGGQSPGSQLWNLSSVTLSSNSRVLSDISFDRIFCCIGERGWAATGSKGEIARTDDGGQSWKVLPPIAGYRNFDSIFFINSDVGWAATTAAPVANQAIVLKTTDGGQTWQPWSSLEALQIRALLDMHLESDGSGWAAGFVMPGQSGVLLRTTDFGKTWQLQGTDDRTLYRLAARPKGKVYAAGSGNILSGGKSEMPTLVYRNGVTIINKITAPTDDLVLSTWEPGSILRSADGGASWATVRLPAPYDGLWLGAVQFANANRGWIAGQNGVILATDDGGKTWHFEAQVKSPFLNDVAVTDRRVIVVGNEGTIFWRERN